MVFAKTPSQNEQSPDGRGVSFGLGDEVKIRKIHPDSPGSEPEFALVARIIPSAASLSQRNATPEGWVPLEKLTVWEVIQDFTPDPGWVSNMTQNSTTRYLALRVGQLLKISHRHTGNWEGWAVGDLWGVDAADAGNGVFPLQYVQQQFVTLTNLP